MGLAANSASKPSAGAALDSGSGVGAGVAVGAGVGSGVGEGSLSTTLTEGVETWEELSASVWEQALAPTSSAAHRAKANMRFFIKGSPFSGGALGLQQPLFHQGGGL